jgi:hypothetical protein
MDEKPMLSAIRDRMEDTNMTRMTTAAAPRKSQPDPTNVRTASLEERQRMIGEAAYYRYAQRGYAPGHDLDDWLAAEADFEQANLRRRDAERDEAAEFGMQYGGPMGPAEDDALKRAIKRHPRRDIPRIDSVEPENAPLKE